MSVKRGRPRGQDMPQMRGTMQFRGAIFLDPAAFPCHTLAIMTDTAIAADSAPISPLAHEVERRRTFAIISHPDAGKTTLTEKLLLFGGAINLAGQVKAKGERR